MRRIVFVLLLAALACSGGEKSDSAGAQTGAAPEAAPASPEAAAATGTVGETITLPSGVKVTHRVIGTGGSLVGYGGGLDNKQTLLALERQHAGAQAALY